MGRLDVWLVQNGYFESREKARFAILAGMVQVNGQVASKPAQTLGESDTIAIVGDALRYVSKGGLKLEKAIVTFGLDFTGAVVLDIGASTGGFTDCALRHGAKQVFAVDVGSDQLHPSLQNRPEIVSLEGLHIRDLNAHHLNGNLADIIVIDVSFISLAKVFPYIGSFLTATGYVVGLIKPQFEMGFRRRVKKGIIKDDQVRSEVLERVREYAAENGFELKNHTPTEADGQEKNVEFMALFFRVER
ncbi:MAG: TlyA family RNA methyltransferase [Saprospiraceae bacterium]|nr:TlyA family RNA methyltransferase [Saprospiraceae bacterium]